MLRKTTSAFILRARDRLPSYGVLAAVNVLAGYKVLNRTITFLQPNMESFVNDSITEHWGGQFTGSHRAWFWSATASANYLGRIAGFAVLPLWMEAVGRRGAGLLLCNALVAAAAALVAASYHLGRAELVGAGNALAGVATAFTSAQVVHVLESARLGTKGSLSLYISLGSYALQSAGALLCLPEVFGSAGRWHLYPLVAAALAICQFAIAYAILPESPRHLLAHDDDYRRARRAIRFYQGAHADIDGIIERIEAVERSAAAFRSGSADGQPPKQRATDSTLCLLASDASADNGQAATSATRYGTGDTMEPGKSRRRRASTKGAVRLLLEHPSLLRPLATSVVGNVALGASAYAASSQYMAGMLLAAGVPIGYQALPIAAIYAAGAAAAWLAASQWVERVGRRPLLILCVALALAGMCCMYAADRMTDGVYSSGHWCTYLGLAGVSLTITSAALGLERLPLLVAAELNAVETRALATAGGSALVAAMHLAQSLAYPPGHQAIGADVWLPFIVIELLCLVYLVLLLPETRHWHDATGIRSAAASQCIGGRAGSEG